MYPSNSMSIITALRNENSDELIRIARVEAMGNDISQLAASLAIVVELHKLREEVGRIGRPIDDGGPR